MRINLDKDAETLKRLIDQGFVSEDDIPLLVKDGMSLQTVEIYWKNKKEDKMSDIQNVIDKLTSAISYKFKEDGTSPGLTISRLKQGQYYCSVVRYPSGGAASKKNKVVVCKAEAGTLDAAVKAVAQAFLIHADHKPNPIEELAELAGLNAPKAKQ